MLCGHYVGSNGVALESCLGYDPPSGLHLWPPKNISLTLLMSGDIAVHHAQLLTRVSI